jgi:DNA-binding SARP family transcriptional activator
MASLHIRLLGDFVIEYDDDPFVAVDSGRLQSVLAYLLLHSRARQSRPHVAFQLWPDSSEEQARGNLRKALHQLRHTLPDADRFLHVDARTVQWRADASYTLDVHEFENELHRAASMTDDPATQATVLAGVVTHYRGALLPSCYDEWIIPERERLRQGFITALERSMRLAEERRDYGAAIAQANHLLRYDPLHEAAYHQLMRFYALNGDRAGALQVYHTCVTVLQRELGVEPGQEIQAAYARLLEMEIPASLQGEAASPAPAREQLVGRQPEWQTLRTTWQQIAHGPAHFCLIEGEAGIGKTRLAEELLAWCERQGIATARTRSYAAAGGLAYTPVIEWLRSEALQAALATLDEIWLTEIARLLPELLVERPSLPRPEPLADRWQRQRLFEALARAFLAYRRPKLLIIDDLQWCDADTLEWLRYLLHFAGQEAAGRQHIAPLLVVGTARAEEIDRDHPLDALLLDLRSTGQLTEVALGPLNASESAELATQLTSRDLDEALATQLYTQTEGNPLFIVETVRAGLRAWRLETADSSPSRHALSPKVQAVIQQRLAQLSPVARELAGLAAAIGRSFTFDLLQAASKDEENEVVRNLDELWQRGIVRTQAGQTYDFSHDRIREVAYGSISPVQRPVLHRRVARALERVYVDDLDPVSAQLAVHYEQAGDAMQAFTSYQRAAAVAVRRFDYAGSIGLIDAGLAQQMLLPETIERVEQEFVLLLEKVESLRIVRGFAVPETAAIHRQLEKLLPQIAQSHLSFLGYEKLRAFCGVSGRMEQAYEFARHLLDLAQQIRDPAFIIRAHEGSGLVHLQLGRLTIARDHLQQASRCFAEATSALSATKSPSDLRPATTNHLALTLYLLGYPEQAVASAAKSVAVAEQMGDPMQIAVAVFFASLVERYLRAVDRVAGSAQRMITLDAQYGGIQTSRVSGHIVQGWVLAQLGRLDEGVTRMRNGIDEFKAANHTMFQTHRLAWLAEAQMQAGLFENAAATLDEGFVMSDQSGQRSGDAELHRLRGEWLVQQGQFAEAEASFDQAVEIARTQAAKSFELRATMSLCRLWQRQGRQAEAHTRLAAIYGWFTEGFDTADLQEAKALLGELA